MKTNTILVLGASGMLGHKMLEVLSRNPLNKVYGTCTSIKSFNGKLPKQFQNQIIENVYADSISTVEDAISKIKPDVVINCIGIIKQKKENSSTQQQIVLNALFPQQVAAISYKHNFRFITIATDCVFDGKKGTPYTEEDLPTCHDVYGMTKYLGEVNDDHNLTLRTSIIGHELKAGVSLIDWFLSQNKKKTKGYKKAIFSGFPTAVLADIIDKKIIPNKDLHGLYQISAEPISKFDLLFLVKEIYKLDIDMIPDESLDINRSLDSQKLRKLISYSPPSWKELINIMHEDYIHSPFYK